MNRFILTFLVIFPFFQASANNLYCPQAIICTASGYCTDENGQQPEPWRWDLFYDSKNPYPNYSMSLAISYNPQTYPQPYWGLCYYQNKGVPGQHFNSLQAFQYVYDKDAPNNSWGNIPNPDKRVIECYNTNPARCPFKPFS